MIGALGLAAIAGIAALLVYAQRTMGQDDGGTQPDTEEDVMPDNSNPVTNSQGTEITNDPSTWPTGDSLWTIARAIAIAEGANVAGSNPDRLNNPGDLSDGFNTYGGEAHSGSNVTNFPDKVTGWQWLYSKLERIRNGNSSVYSSDMTWTQIAQKYAGDWQNWVRNVTNQLGVTPDSTFADADTDADYSAS